MQPPATHHHWVDVLLASSDDAVVTADDTGRVTGWNAGAERLLGWRADEIIGQPTSVIVPPQRGAALGVVQRSVRGGGVAERTHTAFRHRDGGEVEIALTLIALRDPAGVLQGVCGLARDLGQRQRLEHDHRLLAAIVDSSADAVISKDLDGVITSWNRGAEAIFGWSAAEMLGQSTRRLLPPERADEEDAIIERVRRGERLEHFETQRRTKDGRVIEISATLSPIISARGIVGISKIARDITALQRDAALQRELQAKAESAERASALKGEFLANISHELRSPMHAIMGMTETLIHKGERLDADKRVKYLGVVNASARRLLGLIDSLLDLRQLESGNMPFVFSRADLLRQAEAALREVEPLAGERGLALGLGDQRTRALCECDTGRVSQVLINLLANAVRFSPRGGRVTLTLCDAGPERTRVEIRDQGPGIPEDELEDIFEDFVQSSRTRSGSGGTGLGLAISRRIVRAHHGRIWAANNPDGGACFSVELPTTRRPEEPA